MDCNYAVLKRGRDRIYCVRPYDNLDLDEHETIIAIFATLLDAQAYAGWRNQNEFQS